MDLVFTLLAILAVVVIIVVIVAGLNRSRSVRGIDRAWARLAAVAPSTSHFSPEMVADLPEPVQRYVLHAIAPGTPLASAVILNLTGSIRLGNRWNPFTAREILSPHRGFVWRPTVRMGNLVMKGADGYHAQQGMVRFFLWLIPVVSSGGPDVARSAIGRLAGETIWLPAGLLPQHGVAWEALDNTHIQARMTIDGEPVTIQMTIDASGRVEECRFERWHSDQQEFVPFGLKPTEERPFGGYTIPSAGSAGWWFGTDRYESEGEFFRYTIEQVQFL